jgi:hypothetical protein
MRDNGLLMEKKNDEEAESKEEAGDDGEKAAPVESNISSDATEIKTPLGTFVLPSNVPPNVGIAEDAIESLVRWYAREAGVRNLSKYIDKITRKLALQVVAEGEGAELTKKSARKSDSWTVTDENLEDYVGKHIFTSDRLYEKDPLPDGIVMG